jgi:hypothetical protein
MRRKDRDNILDDEKRINNNATRTDLTRASLSSSAMCWRSISTVTSARVCGDQ